MKRLPITFALALALSSGTASAHEYDAGTLHIAHPHARATVVHQTTGTAYLSMHNKGQSADRLLAASSPIAGSVEMHAMSMDGNVMKMREVPAIALQPAATIALEPGGNYHLMLVGLRQPLKAGDKFPLTLTFEKAGKVVVTVMVDGKDAGSAQPAAQHAH